MSAQKRRPQQPHYQSQQPQHQYHQSFPHQYAQDPNYAPFRQQQVYYHPQQYPSADPYVSASTSPYSQHAQYQNALYPPYSQPYAPSSTSVGYQNAIPATYPQSGYLGAADYTATGDLSPSHLTPGSVSSGHSPRVSAGRSRLNTFVFPQGASPSLESQVAHLNLIAPTASLPNKPAPTSRPTSDMASLPSNTQSASGADESRSNISLRYPPLPSVPERQATPPLLRSDTSAPSDAETAKTSSSETAGLDSSVLEYVSSLRSMVEAYEKRDDLLRLRTEAVGFQPKQAWAAWQSADKNDPDEPNKDATTNPEALSNPILGVRLLQRLDKLQRENDELGRLLSSGASLDSNSTAGEAEELRKEVQDCHRLIQAMDKALGSAEARAVASERALEVACRNNSTAMVPGKHAADGVVPPATTTTAETDDKKPSSRNASATRRGSKPTAKSTNTTGGSKNSAAQQQRNTSSKPNNAAKSPGTSGSSAPKSTQNDNPAPPPPSTDAKQTRNGPPRTSAKSGK